MCTLIALWKCHPSAPLVLALNRDEFLDRPTAEPQLWQPNGCDAPVVSGRDLRSGGTWFGVGRGVVAALTNHRSGKRSMPGERSRGELVTRALCGDRLSSLVDELGTLPAESFGPFHLMAVDRERMVWMTNCNGAMECADVPPGIHVLGNYGMDSETDPVVAMLHRELAGIQELPGAELEVRLKSILARHGPGWPCVHLGPYGTRSSSVLWWRERNPSLQSTEGPSCENSWKDFSPLLEKLKGDS